MKVREALLAFAIGMAACSAPVAALDRVLEMKPPRPIAAFTLTDQIGKARAWSTFSGKPTLVFFGFTHCPDICPTTLQRLAQLKTSKGAALRDLQVVMISVDGERDTPAALAEYLSHFSKDFVGLTGPATQVRQIALRFAAPFFKDPPPTDGGGYLVQHSSRLYAIDRQGRLRAELYDAAPETTVAFVQQLVSEH